MTAVLVALCLLGRTGDPRSLKISSDSEDHLKIVLANPKWTLHGRKEGSIPSAFKDKSRKPRRTLCEEIFT